MAAWIERPRFTCSLGGAVAAVTALPKAIPVLHGPSGCAGNLAWTQAGGCGLQVGGYCGGLSMPGSNLQEREVVFGGTERLEEQLRHTLEVMDGDLYVVLSSCVADIIGDDVTSVVNSFAEQGAPVIQAETGGFKGNSYRGYELVVESLLTQYAKADGDKEKRLVNLWGIPPAFDVFWRGNLQGLRDLLGKLGLEVNSFFTVEDNLERISRAGRAALNIVVSDTIGVEAAQKAQELYGTPYLSLPLPIGPTASADFLRQVAKKLRLFKKAAAVIADEQKRFYHILEPLADCFVDMELQRYAAVVGDGNYAAPLTQFLTQDLGWIVEAVAVTDVLKDEQKETLQQRILEAAGDVEPEIIFSGNTSTIRKEVRDVWKGRTQKKGAYVHGPNPAFVVGSSFERELAADLQAGHLSISFPVANRAVLDRGYSGYAGGLHLVEDLLSVIVAGR